MIFNKNDVIVKEMTVQEFLEFKPSKDQFVNGELYVKKNRVNELRPVIKEALTNFTNPIVIYSDRRLMQGHHRQAAAKASIEDNTLNLDFKLAVHVVSKSIPFAEASKMIYLANHGSNSTNGKAHAINSNMPISLKVINPIYTSIMTCNKQFSKSLAQLIAGRLAGEFNNNPFLIECLRKGKDISISGDDIYAAKKYREANKYFYSAEAKCDLRKDIKLLASKLKIAVDMIVEAKAGDNIWKVAVGGSHLFTYTIFGLALDGTLERENYSAKKFKTCLSKNSRKFYNHSTKLQNNPTLHNDALIALMFRHVVTKNEAA